MKSSIILLLTTLAIVPTVHAQNNEIKKELSEEQKKAIKEKYLKGNMSDKELAIKLFKLDLAPFIKTLDREIITFNYRNKSNIKFDPGETPHTDTEAAITYAKEWAGAAKKHLPNESGMYGWGLYSALDTNASAVYGHGLNSYAMVSIKYPEASRMLDLRRLSSYLLPLSKETKEVLSQICPGLETSSNIHIEGTEFTPISKSDLIQNSECHDVYVKALEGLNIAGVIYDWSSIMPPFCDSTRTNASAFVSINLSIKDENIEYYTHLDSELRKQAEKIQKTEDPKKKEELLNGFPLGKKTYLDYEKMAEMFIFNHYSDSFKDFRSTDPEKRKVYHEEFKKAIFGCDINNQDKDAPTYNPEQAWELMLSKDYLNLKLLDTINTNTDQCVER